MSHRLGWEGPWPRCCPQAWGPPTQLCGLGGGLTLVLGPVGDTENGAVLFWGFCKEKLSEARAVRQSQS